MTRAHRPGRWRLVAVLFAVAAGCSLFPTGPSHLLFGKVTNSVTGAPIRGAWVQLRVTTRSTDASGDYVFGDLYPGTYTIRVSHPDYLDAEWLIAVPRDSPKKDLALEPRE